jgi:hypothetical protein
MTTRDYVDTPQLCRFASYTPPWCDAAATLVLRVVEGRNCATKPLLLCAEHGELIRDQLTRTGGWTVCHDHSARGRMSVEPLEQSDQA